MSEQIEPRSVVCVKVDLEGKFWGKHKFLFELYFGVWGKYCSLEKYIYINVSENEVSDERCQWYLKKQRGKKCMMSESDILIFFLHYQIFMKEILLLKLPSIKLANCCVGYFVNGNLLLKSDFNMIVS